VKILAGLGNPGSKYSGTRHNIGFMAVDAIADAQGFGPWRAKFQGQMAEGRLGSEKVLLIKPETFMNLSGQTVGEAMRFYKVEPEDILVFHDELDLAPGKVKLKTGGGHAGHNGLRSLHQHIGEGYARVRLGIGHPGDKRLVSNYVLGEFAKADQEWLAPLLKALGDAAPDLLATPQSGFLTRLALLRDGSGAKPKASPKTPPEKAKPAEPAPDTRSALQKLMDKFS